MDSCDNLNILTDEYDKLYRLPDEVKPIKYKLTLDPNLEEGTFKGHILINVEITETTGRIILNSHCLTMKSLRVHDGTEDGLLEDEQASSYVVESVLIQKERQLLIICMESPLNAGLYGILISYTGNLNSESLGLYRTWISSDADKPRYCVATYFEPTYARFAYPCFDEPHLKAKYSVSLVKPSIEDYIALSNSSVKIEVIDYPRPGATTVHFNETPPISSYLTCFIIGIFEKLEPTYALSGNVPVSVYSQPDLVEQTAFARDLAAKMLEYFSKYFQIDYPFPKLDLIALPDSKLSGMENWGLITFRESSLLINNGDSSTHDYLTVTRVVIHELSHMWFGNLVTLSWWNDTWLKEGMADFMSYIGGNHAYPTWYNEWVFLYGQVFYALQKDSALSSRPVVLPVNHPDQIREMFDVISYLKGSCLFRMLHDLDVNKFRHGLNTYLHKMKWSNACTLDLWQCLSDSLGWMVGDIMGPWTEQSGYPLITINKQGNEFVIKQSRFITDSTSTYDPTTSPYNYLWDVPVKYLTSDDRKVKLFWFNRDKESAVIPCPQNAEWIKINWHNVGYYRVNYSQSMWEQFAQLLQQNISIFDPEDRCNLINDAFSLASAGYIKYDIPLSLIMYLSDSKEDHFLVWSVVEEHLEKLQALLTSCGNLQLFNKYLRKLMNSIVTQLNWDTSENVPYMERKLRVQLISIVCVLGFDSVLDKVRSIFGDWIEKKRCKPCVEIRTIIHTYGLSGCQSDELWEKTWQLYLVEQNPSEVLNLIRSLASTTNPDLITRLINEAKNPDVIKSQDFFIVLRLLSKSAIGNKMVWSFIRNEWEYLVKRFSVNDLNLGRTVSFVTFYFSTQEQLTEVQEFFARYPEAGAGAAERKHALESIKGNIQWINENNDALNNWFSKIEL